MNYDAIVHEQTRTFVYPMSKNQLALRIRTKKNDVKHCKLYYWNRQKSNYEDCKVVEMKCYARDNRYDYFETCIDTCERTKYIKYIFRIDDGEICKWLNYYGITDFYRGEGAFEYLFTNSNEHFKAPKWVREAIFYQIFPERFANGNLSLNPKMIDEWGSVPNRENFMGGDLQGVLEKIDYLKDLGINAIYLNPIFQSPSNHKYDTVDYYKIDEHFGDLELLKKLVEELHANDIKVIFDGVFNHIGYYSAQFQDVIKNGEKSIYKDWFYIDSFPVDTNNINYECVGYYKWMPKLNYKCKAVRKYILDIAKYWILEANIDGWRLDVADEIESNFWYEFRKEIKAINEDCFILGETWGENKEMLYGNQMDSIMNYLFLYAVTDFFAKDVISTLEFDERINQFIGSYQRNAQFTLFNLIGSHDTVRFLTASEGNKNKLKIAVAFQMCFLGIPSIYYGDEIGMRGENDPGCRGAMNWLEVHKEHDLLGWYKRLINIRKNNEALTQGTFRGIYCSENNSVYCFVRETQCQRVYIVINNSMLSEKLIMPTFEESKQDIILNDLLNSEEFDIQEKAHTYFYNQDINDYKGSVSMLIKPYGVKILNTIIKGK